MLLGNKLVLGMALLLLGACAEKAPNFGEKIKNQATTTNSYGKQWLEGDKLIKEGRKQIKEGEEYLSKGSKSIDNGTALVKEGEELKLSAEDSYRDHMQKVTGMAPAPQK